jgi:N-acetyl-gamma-glutamyl-phosphate reductase
MVRGILATCYARPTEGAAAAGLTTETALTVLSERYTDEPFVITGPESPSTKATSGSNCARVTVRVDARTGWIVALCAIDNLVKGAAGQAIQCANLAVGLPEGRGLPIAATYP